MNVQIKSRNLTGMEEIEGQILKKVERFRHLVPENGYIEVELKQFSKSLNSGDKEAEIIADIPGYKSVVRFTAQADNFLSAVDIILDKLDRELSREKDKAKDHSLRHQRPMKEVIADAVNHEEL